MKTSRWLWPGILALTGLLIIPVAAYIAGGRLAGPYGGPRGLGSYLSAVYGDALRGDPLALTMLTSPLLVAGLWWLRARVLRMLLPRSDENAS